MFFKPNKLPKLMVAPNGARPMKKDHPLVPITIDEIVETAKACFAAALLSSAKFIHPTQSWAAGLLDASAFEIWELHDFRAASYLALAPSVVCASSKAIEILKESTDLIKKITLNTKYFRQEIKKLGFEIKSGTHPIVPIMLYDASLAKQVSQDMLKLGIYVVGFSYPVVPKKEARIRVQISADHSKKHLMQALDAFYQCGKKYGLI